MVEIEVPGRTAYRLQHLVLDVNGTVAVDGRLVEGVARKLPAPLRRCREVFLSIVMEPLNQRDNDRTPVLFHTSPGCSQSAPELGRCESN